MADDCSVPSRCRGSLFLPVTAEICYVISRLWSLPRCPGWAVPASVALLGCPRGSGWMQCPCPQHSRRSCCPSEEAEQTALRKERAEQKAWQQQAAQEPGFRALFNKSISNIRLGMFQGAGRTGTWLEVSWELGPGLEEETGNRLGRQ